MPDSLEKSAVLSVTVRIYNPPKQELLKKTVKITRKV
jgi:hypothetical protein